MKSVFTVSLVVVLVFFCYFFVTVEAKRPHQQQEEEAVVKPQWLEGASVMKTTVPPLNRLLPVATARVAGFGYYHFKVNGQRVDPTRKLSGEWTPYNLTAEYDVYEIQSFLSSETENEIEFFVSGGHFSVNWYRFSENPAHNKTVLFFQLFYGPEQTEQYLVRSSSRNDLSSWSCIREELSPFREATLYGGVTYDQRLEIALQNETEKKKKFQPCRMSNFATRKLIEREHPPIREQVYFSPISNWTVGEKQFFDFGQNTAGVLRTEFDATSCPSGTSIIFQHAEILWPNRTLNRLTLGLANATDYFITSSSSSQKLPTVFLPDGTYHGFRYASVQIVLPSSSFSSAQDCFKLRKIEFVHFRSDVKPRGFFTSSSKVLNAIHSLCLWSLRSNIMSIITDCDQRDERLGWLLDSHASASAGSYNLDMNPLYYNFVTNVIFQSFSPSSSSSSSSTYSEISSDPLPLLLPVFAPNCDPEPSPNGTDLLTLCNRDYTYFPGDISWSDAAVIIALKTYKHTGNKRILQDNYQNMKNFVMTLQKLRVDPKTGIVEHNLFGDWLPWNFERKSGGPGSRVNGKLATTASYVKLLQDTSKIAAVLQQREDARLFEKMANTTIDNFNKAFFDRKSCSYKTEFGYQAAISLAFSINAVPEPFKKCVAESLVTWIRNGELCRKVLKNGTTVVDHCNPGHFGGGVLSWETLPHVLVANGNFDLALELVSQTSFPSLGYMWKRGATTLWENAADVFLPTEGASHNHHMWASIEPFFFQHVVGINIEIDTTFPPSPSSSLLNGRTVTVTLENLCKLKNETASARVYLSEESDESNPNKTQYVEVSHDLLQDRKKNILSSLKSSNSSSSYSSTVTAHNCEVEVKLADGKAVVKVVNEKKVFQTIC